MLTVPLLLVTSALAGPLNESSLPPDPAFVLHVDLDAARTTKLGRHILDNPEKFNLEGLGALEAFGINPLQDFHSVMICAPKGKTDMGVVTVETTKAIDKLVDHLKTEPHAKTMTVDGLEILSWDDNGTRKYAHIKAAKGGAGEDRTVSVCDDWEVLATTLKTAGAGKATAAAPRPGTIFLFRTADLASLAAKDDDDNAKAIFGGATNATFESGEAEGKVFIKASVQCGDAQTASDLKEVLGGVLAFARLAPKGNPDAAPLADASKAAKVTAEGRTLSLDAQWDSAQAASVLETVVAMEKNKHEQNEEDEDDKGDKGEKGGKGDKGDKGDKGEH